MNHRGRFTKLYILAIFLIFNINNAYSYIDPNTSNLIIQVLLASFVAVSLGLKIFWVKIKTFFKSILGKK